MTVPQTEVILLAVLIVCLPILLPLRRGESHREHLLGVHFVSMNSRQKHEEVGKKREKEKMEEEQ